MILGRTHYILGMIRKKYFQIQERNLLVKWPLDDATTSFGRERNTMDFAAYNHWLLRGLVRAYLRRIFLAAYAIFVRLFPIQIIFIEVNC